MSKDYLKKGARVRLTGLVGDPALNDAIGVVVGPPQGDPPRFPVRLLRPQSIVAAYPQGIRVKRENIQLATTPPTAAQPQAAAATSDSSSGAAASTASSRFSGILPTDVRLRLSLDIAEKFIEALAADLYPSEGIERLFGVQKDYLPEPQRSPMQPSEMPIGNLVFGAWITIRNSHCRDRFEAYLEAELAANGGDEDEDWDAADARDRRISERVAREFKEEVGRALAGGVMKEWYEAQLQQLTREGKASYYVAEIMKRGFQDIPWDVSFLDRLSGRG